MRMAKLNSLVEPISRVAWAKVKMVNSPRLVVAVTHPMSAMLVRGQLSHAKKKGFHVALLSSPGELPRRIADAEGVDLLEVKMEREIALWRDLRALCKIFLLFRKDKPTLINTG